MSTYLSRPVFDFPLNWKEQPTRSFTYDLRLKKLGQAAEQQAPLQTAVARGLAFDLLLHGESAIASFDSFASACRGRLNGFWIQNPSYCCMVQATSSSNVMDVVTMGWSKDWSDDLDLHLIIENAAGWQYAKISGVEDLENGLERVTLISDSGRVISVGDAVIPLLYCRFSTDAEEWTWEAAGVQSRSISVIELPTEYAAVETGTRPVYLYEFNADHGGEMVYWRMTSLDVDIASNLGGATSHTYTSRSITHRGHRRSMRLDQDDVTIESFFADWNPMALFIPARMPVRLGVKIYQTTYATPDTVTLIFAGGVDSVEANGSLVTAKASSWITMLGRKFPRMLIQPRCNYEFGGAACGIDRGHYTTFATVTSHLGKNLILQVTNPPISGNATSARANFFSYGYLETIAGAAWQVRGVDQSTAVYTKSEHNYMGLVLVTAPVGDLTGTLVTVRAGCDLSNRTCEEKFGNFARWGGHVTPTNNPSVRAMEADLANGNKK